MGTRSLTVVLEEDGPEICVLYRHNDGYPTGHGSELKEFLTRLRVVNGLSSGQEGILANGMGCLAAQLVAHFKTGPGGFYLYPTGTRDCGEEYVYTVYIRRPEKRGPAILSLKIQAGAVTYFGFPGTKQGNMPVLYDGPVIDFDPELVQRQWKARDEDPVNDFVDHQVLSSEVIDTD